MLNNEWVESVGGAIRKGAGGPIFIDDEAESSYEE